MKDRVSTYPGRVRLTPVSGQTNVYDLERADQPTEVGTPLNKANLLTDVVAALLGGNSTMTPNQAFNVLAENFYAYAWRRFGKSYKAAYGAHGITYKVYTNGIALGPISSSYGTQTKLQTSKNISIDSNGTISLVSPTTYTVSSSNGSTIGTAISNGYFKITQLGASNYVSEGLNTSDIYYCDSTATLQNSSYTECISNGNIVKKVSSEAIPKDSEEVIIKSTNSSAYPNPNGVSGDYYYEYIGRLIDRVYEARPIAVVKYIGTGTYGSANPIEVTFPFAPRYVMVYAYRWPSATYTSLINNGISVYNHPLDTNLLTTSYQAELLPSMTDTSYRAYYYGKKSADGKTISWYCTQNSSTPGSLHHNKKDYEYICVGIG